MAELFLGRMPIMSPKNSTMKQCTEEVSFGTTAKERQSDKLVQIYLTNQRKCNSARTQVSRLTLQWTQESTIKCQRTWPPTLTLSLTAV